VFFGLNHKAPAPKKHVVKETDVVQMVMPEIKDLDEPPPTELQDDTQNTPQVDVPSLADMPSAVDVSMGFVQPLDVRPPVPADIGAARLAVVPVNIAHGPRSDGGGLKDIFNLADLDRIPEAISQVAPRFPAALKREFDYAEVKLEFIVDTAGGVRGITIVSSTAQGFDEAAVEGISKWRFRPGMKAGKKVNTRVQQLLKFKVTDDDK
jgi:protein TonB